MRSSATFTENLLAYALGRVLDYHDMPMVRVDRARRRRKNDNRFSSFVLGIVKSSLPDEAGGSEPLPCQLRPLPKRANLIRTGK